MAAGGAVCRASPINIDPVTANSSSEEPKTRGTRRAIPMRTMTNEGPARRMEPATAIIGPAALEKMIVATRMIEAAMAANRRAADLEGQRTIEGHNSTEASPLR